jgi:hypothetical protein
MRQHNREKNVYFLRLIHLEVRSVITVRYIKERMLTANHIRLIGKQVMRL